MLRLGKVSVQSLQHYCSLDVVLQIIKSLIKLIGLIAVVYILLPLWGIHPLIFVGNDPVAYVNDLCVLCANAENIIRFGANTVTRIWLKPCKKNFNCVVCVMFSCVTKRCRKCTEFLTCRRAVT